MYQSINVFLASLFMSNDSSAEAGKHVFTAWETPV